MDRLQELGRHAEELGILMSLEMYEDTFLGTADSAVRLVQDIGMDNVGLNPDIGNLVRLHRPIESWWEVVEKTLPYANFWHVKNYARDEDPAREAYFAVPAPMPSGLIDYRRAFRYAIEQGFEGVICVENYGGDGLSVCADNRDYLRRHVLPQARGIRTRHQQGAGSPATIKRGQLFHGRKKSMTEMSEGLRTGSIPNAGPRRRLLPSTATAVPRTSSRGTRRRADDTDRGHGSGYMGGGMAQVFALAGHEVVVSDVTADIAASNLERIRTETREFEDQGLFRKGATDVIVAHVSAGTESRGSGRRG